MDKPKTRKDVRAQIRAERKTAQLAREALERANVGDLTEVKYRQAQLDEVDTWLRAQVARVTEAAEARRDRHKVAIGKALQTMRLRGESMRGIAAQSGLTERQIRDYMQTAAASESGEETSTSAEPDDSVDPAAQVLPAEAGEVSDRALQPADGEAAR